METSGSAVPVAVPCNVVVTNVSSRGADLQPAATSNAEKLNLVPTALQSRNSPSGSSNSHPKLTCSDSVPVQSAEAAASGDGSGTIVGSDEPPTPSKRFFSFPYQRRGSRKKTLSLNPEEREALENLIEEVIMDGVGEGVIDSDASSSDEDEGVFSSASGAQMGDGSSKFGGVSGGDGSHKGSPLTLKGGKKFYPGQLKVALKHMHDLPPRFVRKLAKAQVYLDTSGSGGLYPVFIKPTNTVERIVEDEEAQFHPRNDVAIPVAVSATAAGSLQPDRDRDRAKVKENKLKEAKKKIRTMLSDRDQYVDEKSATSDVAAAGGVQTTTATSESVQSAASGARQHADQSTVPQGAITCNDLERELKKEYSPHSARTNVAANSSNPPHADTLSVEVADFLPKGDPTSVAAYRQNVSPAIPTSAVHQTSVKYSPAMPPQQNGPTYPQQQIMQAVLAPAAVGVPEAQYWIPSPSLPSSGSAAAYYGSSPPSIVGIPSAIAFQPQSYAAYSVPQQYSLSGYPTAAPAVYAASQFTYQTVPPPPTVPAAPPPPPQIVATALPPYSVSTYVHPASYQAPALSLGSQYNAVSSCSDVPKTAILGQGQQYLYSPEKLGYNSQSGGHQIAAQQPQTAIHSHQNLSVMPPMIAPHKSNVDGVLHASGLQQPSSATSSIGRVSPSVYALNTASSSLAARNSSNNFQSFPLTSSAMNIDFHTPPPLAPPTSRHVDAANTGYYPSASGYQTSNQKSRGSAAYPRNNFQQPPPSLTAGGGQSYMGNVSRFGEPRAQFNGRHHAHTDGSFHSGPSPRSNVGNLNASSHRTTPPPLPQSSSHNHHQAPRYTVSQGHGFARNAVPPAVVKPLTSVPPPPGLDRVHRPSSATPVLQSSSNVKPNNVLSFTGPPPTTVEANSSPSVDTSRRTSPHGAQSSSLPDVCNTVVPGNQSMQSGNRMSGAVSTNVTCISNDSEIPDFIASVSSDKVIGIAVSSVSSVSVVSVSAADSDCLTSRFVKDGESCQSQNNVSVGHVDSEKPLANEATTSSVGPDIALEYDIAASSLPTSDSQSVAVLLSENFAQSLLKMFGNQEDGVDVTARRQWNLSRSVAQSIYNDWMSSFPAGKPLNESGADGRKENDESS